jgi:hypothetical protein
MLILPLLYQSTILGTSVRPRAAESRADPPPARHQLERPRGNLLPRAGRADDGRNTPTSMAAFERLVHELHIAHAFETVIGAVIGELDKVGHEIARDFLRIDEMRHAERTRELFARGVDIDTHDHVGARDARPG